MKRRLAIFFLAWTAVGVFAAAGSDEILPHRQDQPPNRPYSPQEALSKMTVPAGFHVDLVASEPEIVNPIAMTFDDRGRIWITESVEYPRKPAGPGRDRVKRIEGVDANGHAKAVTLFADGLNIPTGIAVGYGGVWVLNSPDLLFFREKDGQAASPEVVLTGFGRTDFHELPSSLTWGPDGWLYGLNGVFNESHVVSQDGKKHDFTCAMWRFHPRTREFQVFAEGTSNPYGIAWDAEGSAIIEACHWANDHLFHFVETGCYQRQAGAYPPFAMKIGSITDHGHQKTAYCGIAYLDTDAFPISYRGRIVVGNLHGGCLNLDRLERDGATYLAKAEPDLLTANDAWFMPVSLKVGPDGCLYVLDWYDRYHCSQDAVRDPEGVDRLRGRLYRLCYGDAPRAPQFDLSTEGDDQLIARLASPNLYFREGAQRILTERLSSGTGDHSAQLRAKLETLAGADLGTTNSPAASIGTMNPGRRAYSPSPPTKGGEGRGEEDRSFFSVAPLPAPASRGEGVPGQIRKDPSFVTSAATNRAARLQALWALIGSGSLETSFHQRLLSSDDATFRAWGVRAAGNMGKVNDTIRERVVALAHDPSPDVQLQVAVASRKIDGCDALPVLVAVLMNCAQDKLMPAIVWPNLHPLLESESARFVALLRSGKQSAVGDTHTSEQVAPAMATLLPRVIDRVLSARHPDSAAATALLDYAIKKSPERAPECISAVSAKLGELNDTTIAALKEQLRPLVEAILGENRSTPLRFSAQLLATRLNLASIDADEVRRTFLSRTEDQTRRLQALEALIAFRDASLLDVLPGVFSSVEPQFTTRVFAALGRCDDLRLADLLLAGYAKLAPELQPLAIDLILQREPWTRKLLDAVRANKLPKSVLNANHLRKILESDDREAIWEVEKVFGKIREERNPDREKVVAEMVEFLRTNLGNPLAGQRVFKNLCAQCHTIYGEGGNVGPDLTSNGRGSFEQVVASVFDPSLVIGPGYQTVTVVTKDGRNLTGLVTEESDQRVVLKMPGEGEESVPRNNIKYTRVSKLSMMPEGIEALLGKRDLADLFAFLSFDKPPADPTAKPIPGAPVETANAPRPSGTRINVERLVHALNVRARIPGQTQSVDLVTYVMEPELRPYLHPVQDASGRVILTDDKPADHPWQHGIFTGFHRVNGVNYWKEDEGRQHFVRLLDLKEEPDRVSWRALVEFVAPNGGVVLEEEDAITIHAPESADAYVIDFDLLLRAREREVNFGKFFVGGLAVRMPWEKANPRQTHLNSTGLRGRDAEQKRAAWCNVERPFADEIFGIAIFDHPANPQHPPGWRVDEQGLINPNVSALGDWSIPAKQERLFRYRLLVYRGAATHEQLAGRFEKFAETR